MTLAEVQEFFFPRAEKDEGFRQEVARLARRSLYIIGAVDIVMPILALPIGLWAAQEGHAPFPQDSTVRWLSMLGFFCLGGLTIAVARTKWVMKCPRLIGALSGLASAAVIVWVPLATIPDEFQRQATTETGISLLFVQIVAVAIIPLRPAQMFAFGAAVGALFWSSLAAVMGWNWTVENLAGNHAVHMVPLATALCTGLSAVNYQRLAATYWSHRETIRAQTRILLAESAASMGRLTAALSHELNTPTGALRSAIDTLGAIAERKAAATGELRGRLDSAERELRDVAMQSADRLQETLRRIQRLTNLDRAEVLTVDLNALLEDVGSSLQPRADGGVTLATELHPLPKITVHPQQISAALSHLVHHAIQEAQPGGRVSLRTRAADSVVEVRIHHSGQGWSDDKLAKIFDPIFQIEGRRIAAGNWDLFASRQLIREHSGDICAERASDGGVLFLVSLPVEG